ncbi:MAG TPA: hypothetical protein VEU96_01065 [Bryobacteraceae bacterium]|nr:hypothetical protein [Bryobacteraceae bacterium]
MRPYFCGLGITALLLLGSSVAYGQQQHRVDVDDNGQVIKAHEHMHAKNGHKIAWRRASGASKSWSVTFTDSPCAEGATFGSNGPKICTVKVTCAKAGDAGCRAYAYVSSTSPGAQQHDPDIIIDP